MLGHRDAGDGRAALASTGELGADPGGGPVEARVHVVGRRRGLPGELRELLDGDAAREVARVVAAHAVRHEEDRWVGQEGVLVDLADEATVGRRTPRRAHATPLSWERS